MCERELETEQNCNILIPHSYGHQRCVFLVLLMLNRRPEGSAFFCLSLPHLVTNSSDLQLNRGSQRPLLPRGGFPYHTCLQLVWSTHWLPVFTELFKNSIAHSISILMASQAGICHFRHLWTGMLDHHQAEITVILFRGHSLLVHRSMSVPWDFTLSHFVSQARLRNFIS